MRGSSFVKDTMWSSWSLNKRVLSLLGKMACRNVMVTSVTVNHGKIPDVEGQPSSFNTMVAAAVDNHGVENSQDTLSKSPYAGAACNGMLV